VRRALPAVGQLLPAAGQLRERLSALRANRALRRLAAPRCGPADPGHDHRRTRRGESLQQPGGRRGARRPRVRRRAARDERRARLAAVEAPVESPAPRPPGARVEHLIGLLLGTEDDWSTAFERLLERLGTIQWRG